MTGTAAPPRAKGMSQSEVAQWYRCRRRWFVEQYLGYLPANPSPLGPRNQGIRLHAALEAWYGPHHFDPVFITDLLYGAALELNPDDEAALRAEHEMSKIIIEGYMAWLEETGADNGLAVIEPEAQVRVPLPGWEGVVDLRAKMDQVMQDAQTGYLWFLDHKRTDNFDRYEVNKLREDPQMRYYSLIQWIASGQPPPVLGQPPMVRDDVPLVLGGKVNLLRAVKRSAKSKPPYYDRRDFRHTYDQMAVTLAEAQQAAFEIMDARTHLDAAYSRGGLIEQINWIQVTKLHRNWINHDCTWSCPHVNGLCQMMSDGTACAEMLVNSGRYVQDDPYIRYESSPLDMIRDQLASR
jgi:PD-(D/E)XK nuclease superfamily